MGPHMYTSMSAISIPVQYIHGATPCAAISARASGKGEDEDEDVGWVYDELEISLYDKLEIFAKEGSWLYGP